MATEELRETKNRIDYTVMIVRDFGDAHQLTPRQAHNYLRRHKAMDFLDKCYEAEHTLSPNDAVDDVNVVSKRYGGKL